MQDGITIHSGTYTPISVSACDPQDYTSLANSLLVALQAEFTAPAVQHSTLTRKFSIDTGPTYVGGAAVDANGYFVAFHFQNTTAQQPARPADITATGWHNDSYVILGAAPTTLQGSQSKQSFPQPAFMATNGTVSLGTTQHISPYPTCLSSLESLVLRTEIPTSNWQSSGYERNRPQSDKLQHSSIFARLPVDSKEDHITFQNSGDQFQLIAQARYLDRLVFSVTDDQGRALPGAISPNPASFLPQEDYGLLSYRMCLRWDAMELTPSVIPRHVSDHIANSAPKLMTL